MAKITYDALRDITTDYPVMYEELKRFSYNYDDSRKKFVYRCLMKVDYMQSISKPMFHDLYFMLKSRFIDTNEHLLKENDETDSLFILETGMLQVYTEFEGNKFIIDNLCPGSVIGHKGIFMEDTMVVNIRATRPTFLSELREDDF